MLKWSFYLNVIWERKRRWTYLQINIEYWCSTVRRFNIFRHALRQKMFSLASWGIRSIRSQWTGQMASYEEEKTRMDQMFWSHIVFFVIKDIGVQTAIHAKYTVYNDSQPVSLLYTDLFVYLQFSHLRLVWYWRPTKNNYPWCRRQAELNWKPWQHSACLSNPLALPESRQIPAQAPAYSTPA